MVSKIRGSCYCKLQIQWEYVWQFPVFELIVSHNIAKWCQTKIQREYVWQSDTEHWLIEPGCIMKLSVPQRRHIGRKHLKKVFLKFLKRKIAWKIFLAKEEAFERERNVTEMVWTKLNFRIASISKYVTHSAFILLFMSILCQTLSFHLSM